MSVCAMVKRDDVCSSENLCSRANLEKTVKACSAHINYYVIVYIRTCRYVIMQVSVHRGYQYVAT